MGHLIQDVKYALRMFTQQRAFTAAAVAALALGIGATTAVFSVVDAVLLRPFPFPDPSRIVLFMETSKGRSVPTASPSEFAFWAQQTDALQDISAFNTGIINYTSGDTPEQLTSGTVSASFFRLFGATTALGRTFSAEEDRPSGGRVAVLSYGWWTRRFGADPNVVGKTIQLGGVPYTVIGVVGRTFDPADIGDTPDVWLPFQLDPNSADIGHYFLTAGRIKPGFTLAQAQQRLIQSANAYREKFPHNMQQDDGFTVSPLQEVFSRGSKTLLIVMLAAVGGVLLIACANVANLLLVRATVRKREMAIRSAIGADSGRIMTQLLTESVLLAVLGGVLGLALGLLGIRALLSINTAGLPRVGDGGSLVHLDWRLLAFTAAVALGTGLVFGVMPAIHASRSDLSDVLREGSGGGGGGRRTTIRSVLVVLEMSLALSLVIGSGLLIRTSLALRAVSPGFSPDNVLTMKTSFTGPRYQGSMAVNQSIHDGLVRLRSMPGVVTAGAACCLPLQGGFGLPFRIVGRPVPPGRGDWLGGGAWTTISPGYFETFKIPVLRGRSFTDQDVQGSTPVAIINESMVKQYWKDKDPLADHLVIGRGIMAAFKDEPDRQIVGVVADSRDNGLNQDPGPKMFIPQAQMPDSVNALNMRLAPNVWVIRTRSAPMTMRAQIEDALHQSTGLPVSDVRTMDEVVSRSTSRQRFNAFLMAVFAASALALAAIGIYGVMAYAVQQRTREIGLRLALGAEPGTVRGMVIVQGMRLAAAGVAIGVAVAFALSRYLSSMLFGVQTRDPLVFVGVPLLLAFVALLSVWLPAARASRIDPLNALRIT